MALIQRLSQKIQLANRFYSKKVGDIKKSVFISQSNDIYTNLALEEWLYSKFDFKNHHVLLLCQNDPCIVIGEHQNPWSETNFSDLPSEEGVRLARRSSSSGVVYQDSGCLSVSFLSPKERQNLTHNAEIVARSLFREFGCKTSVGHKDELYLRNNKQVSNNTSKVGEINSYHSMSLMVKSNKLNRNIALQKHDIHVNTTVGQLMTPPKMMNLCEENPGVTVQSLIKAVGWEFLRTKALSGKDGGMTLASEQKGFHLINPTENWFPGLNAIRTKYSSWNWCFGNTPKFNITRSFVMPGGFSNSNTGSSTNLNVTITVESGRIIDIILHVPYELQSIGFSEQAQVIHSLKGKKFSVQAFVQLEDSLETFLDDKDRFVRGCVKQVMTQA